MHQFHFAMNRASTLPKLKGLVSKTAAGAQARKIYRIGTALEKIRNWLPM
jgi:hypothetical protein